MKKTEILLREFSNCRYSTDIDVLDTINEEQKKRKQVAPRNSDSEKYSQWKGWRVIREFKRDEDQTGGIIWTEELFLSLPRTEKDEKPVRNNSMDSKNTNTKKEQVYQTGRKDSCILLSKHLMCILEPIYML